MSNIVKNIDEINKDDKEVVCCLQFYLLNDGTARVHFEPGLIETEKDQENISRLMYNIVSGGFRKEVAESMFAFDNDDEYHQLIRDIIGRWVEIHDEMKEKVRATIDDPVIKPTDFVRMSNHD